MSIIVPAGKKNVNWSPKETNFEKTASAEGGVQEQDVEVDALYEAAKGVVEAAAAKEKECKECKCDPCECSKEENKSEVKKKAQIEVDVVEDVEDVENVEDAVEDIVEDEVECPEEGRDQSISEAVAEVEQKAEEAEAVVEAVSEALESVEEAVQGVRDAAGVVEEVSDEVDIDIPGEEVVDGDVVVEGEPETEGCMGEDEDSVEKVASSEEFCKFAKLTPLNKKKLSNYWINMLGYPRDYVNLLTKDYEK